MKGTRSILVTGGGRGIGRSVALLAGDQGWNVGIGFRSDQSAAERTVSELIARGGAGFSLCADVTREADVAALFDSMQSHFGGCNGLVINAGIVAPASPLAEMSVDRIRHVFEVNVLGSFLCAREAARRFRGVPSAGSSVVIVSSVAARLGSPNEYVDYAASKAALDTLTVGLAKELAPAGVRVNAVRPGLINTDLHASGGDAGRVSRLSGSVPLGRAGEPGEVAEAVIWLLSEAASYVTGAVLDVSGGR